MDLNTDTSIETRTPPGSSGGSGGSERPSVRDSLRQSFADARRDEETRSREADTRPEDEEVVEEVTEPVEPDTEAEAGADRDTPTGGETQETEEKPAPRAEAAPVSWTKEAKAEWTKLPDRIRKEVLKREKDMERGVEAIKNQYKEVDDALAPYIPTIKQFGKTPGQAVAQLFAWFDALAKNPDEAFPALIQSYKYNPEQMLAKYGYRRVQQQQPNGQVQNGQVQNGQAQPGQQQADIPPAVKNYISQLEQKLNGFQNQVGQQFNSLGQFYQEQSAAKTQEMLERWSADKPHFDKVRVLMGHLLTPDPTTGEAAIPLKDGKVDLDAAYDAAVYASPEVREMLLADAQAKADAARKAKQDAAIKAQKEKTEAARRASGSLTSSAPGAEVSRRTVPEKGKSVRDSLRQAISELSDR